MIWKVNIHNINKNFLWRLAKNILPTKVNLAKKGIVMDTSYPLCLSSPESAEHLFLNCEFSKYVFFSSILSYRVPPDLDICSWLLLVLSCGDPLCIQLISTMAAQIWNARNLICLQQKCIDPRKVVVDTLDHVCEFNKGNQRPTLRKYGSVLPVAETIPNGCHFLQVDAGLLGKVLFLWAAP